MVQFLFSAKAQNVAERVPGPQQSGHFFNVSSRAFMATITVLADTSTHPGRE